MRKFSQIILVILALALTVGVCSVLTMAAKDGDNDKKKKRREVPATTGQISVKTSTGNYPILINGKPAGLSGNPTATEIPLPPGTYTVEVLFPNKSWSKEVVVEAGKSSCICLAYKTGSITKPCPYEVSMSAPEEVVEGDLVTFASIPTFTDGANPTLNYRWRVTPENTRVTSGLGTSSITIDTKDLGNQTIYAELEVGDGATDASCLQTVKAQTRVRKLETPTPFKFDDFDSRTFDDDKARLDNFAIELQNRTDSQGYIIVYGGVSKRSMGAERIGTRTVDYLVKTRGVDGRRLSTVNGGYRQKTGYELWIIPPGATAPAPSPTIANPPASPKRKK